MTASRGVYRRRRDAKLTPAQIRATWVLYERGYSLRQIGGLIWETQGFASAKSAANTLHTAFLAEGRKLRDRIDATRAASTTHGLRPRSGPSPGYLELRRRRRRERGEVHDRICTATVVAAGRRHGKSCRLHALADSEFCFAHDPRLAEQRRAILTEARSRKDAR